MCNLHEENINEIQPSLSTLKKKEGIQPELPEKTRADGRLGFAHCVKEAISGKAIRISFYFPPFCRYEDRTLPYWVVARKM